MALPIRGVHIRAEGFSITLRGNLRNTGNNYNAELAGALAAVHNTPTNAPVTLITDNLAVLSVLRPILLAHAAGIRFEWTEQRRIRMPGGPLITAFRGRCTCE